MSSPLSLNIKFIVDTTLGEQLNLPKKRRKEQSNVVFIKIKKRDQHDKSK